MFNHHDHSRNIQSISKEKLSTLRLATELVVKRMTVSGGHGSHCTQCACSTPIALSLDVQTLEPVLIASVDRDCRLLFSIHNPHIALLFGFYHSCPALECHRPHKCKGDFVNSISLHHLEECIEICNNNVPCKWFTFEKSNDICMMYEDCSETLDCATCASGPKLCSHGNHGMQLMHYIFILCIFTLTLLFIRY